MEPVRATPMTAKRRRWRRDSHLRNTAIVAEFFRRNLEIWMTLENHVETLRSGVAVCKLLSKYGDLSMENVKDPVHAFAHLENWNTAMSELRSRGISLSVEASDAIGGKGTSEIMSALIEFIRKFASSDLPKLRAEPDDFRDIVVPLCDYEPRDLEPLHNSPSLSEPEQTVEKLLDAENGVEETWNPAYQNKSIPKPQRKVLGDISNAAPEHMTVPSAVSASCKQSEVAKSTRKRKRSFLSLFSRRGKK